MKKSILKVTFLFSLVLTSCTEEKFITTENNTNTANVERISSLIPGVESMYINNGLTTNCENNILVFPSWESYYATIETLDQQTEVYCDAFDATVPIGVTDEQYDALCLAANFDEDNILLNFENDLKFCSLRQKINAAEEAWLNTQSATGPFVGNDPDDDFIDDDTERALLNEGHEVIIGSREKGYVIYKFIDDLGNFYQINNMDLEVLQAINHGDIPEGNSNLVINSQPPTYSECKEGVKEINMEYGTVNRFKRISKIRKGAHAPFGPSKIKATTKGYKLKRGKWKRRRTDITASINGIDLSTLGIIYVECSSKYEELLVTKSKKRRRVSVARDCPEVFKPVHGDERDSWNVIDNKIYSYHQQGSLIVSKDYYDMPNN